MANDQPSQEPVACELSTPMTLDTEALATTGSPTTATGSATQPVADALASSAAGAVSTDDGLPQKRPQFPGLCLTPTAPVSLSQLAAIESAKEAAPAQTHQQPAIAPGDQQLHHAVAWEVNRSPDLTPAATSACEDDSMPQAPAAAGPEAGPEAQLAPDTAAITESEGHLRITDDAELAVRAAQTTETGATATAAAVAVDSEMRDTTREAEGDAEEHPEWEVDSSPYESSSDSSSSSSSDDSSSDDDSQDEDYTMLNPEEVARMLMAAEGGSDDESGQSKQSGTSYPRTANEKPEEIVPVPDIRVTPEMRVELLGSVETIVENVILIRGNTSGEYQVLETGSVLCLETLEVIGVVADTLGRVDSPLYTVRFTNRKAIDEFGIAVGKPVFYLHEHSTFVFTEPLKGLKGSDASNFHDEEVAEDEMEFSDDEAEAAYKRAQKQAKKARKEGSDRAKPRQQHPQPAMPPRPSRGELPGPSGLREAETLNYDDDSGSVQLDDDGYTPLTRPTNYHELLRPAAPLAEPLQRSVADRSPRVGRGRGRGRGRYGFDRIGGRGGGYDRGRDASVQQGHGSQPSSQYPQQHQQPQYHQQQAQPSQQQHNHAISSAHTPQPMTAAASAPPAPLPFPFAAGGFNPALMSSLLAQAGNVPASQMGTSPQPQPPAYFNAPNLLQPGLPQQLAAQQLLQQLAQSSQQQQQHQQPLVPQVPSNFPPPGSHVNPAFFPAFQQQQQQQGTQPSQAQAPSQQPQPNVQGQVDAFAAAQAQLDILRRLNGPPNGGSAEPR